MRINTFVWKARFLVLELGNHWDIWKFKKYTLTHVSTSCFHYPICSSRNDLINKTILIQKVIFLKLNCYIWIHNIFIREWTKWKPLSKGSFLNIEKVTSKKLLHLLGFSRVQKKIEKLGNLNGNLEHNKPYLTLRWLAQNSFICQVFLNPSLTFCVWD